MKALNAWRIKDMSNLSSLKTLLAKGCFCHNSDVKWNFECMPASLTTFKLEDCGQGVYCYHNQETQIKEALERFLSFMEKQANFKVGDRVELSETPYINPIDSPGWMSCKHFLVKGAKGTIRDVSYHGNEFGYSVSFDDESWLDSKGNLHPKNDKSCIVPGCTFGKHNAHTFFFSEHKLSRASVKPCEFLTKLWYDFYSRIGD